MRILAIRGRNLASLARSFAVELAQGELANAGLFAITGPVGAGKSTLLDALCLALFDRTPRLTGRGGTLIGDDGQERGDWLRANDPRTLLRRNAVDGHAEVDFIGRDGVPYRSRWSVRRARRRPDGRLQDQELILHDLRQDTVVASGRRSEVLAAIKQRLGLDFSQFCRSVLLAQGEFHAFLHAAADERAKLLETLTGAQLYRRLSRRAHEKRREQDNVVKTLRAQHDQCQVLAPDVRKKLEEDAARYAAQLQICDVGITIAQNYVLWHQDAERRREQEEKAMVALQEAVATSRAADARREQLQARQRAMAAVPRWEVAREARAKAKQALGEVDKAKRQHEALAAKAADAEQQWVELVTGHLGSLETVPRMVRDLPQWLPSLRRWHDTEQASAIAERELAKMLVVAENSEREFAAKSKGGAALEQAVIAAEAAVAQAEDQLAEADYDQVAARRRELAAQQAKLLQAATALQQWQQATSVAKLARDAAAASTAEVAELEPVRGKTQERLVATGQELAKVREQVRVAEQQHGLEALRAHLVDGEACPLCGSEEHHVHSGEQPDLALVRDAVQLAERAHEQAQRDAAQAESNWQRMQRELATRQKELQAADASLAAARSAFAELAEESLDLDPPRLDEEGQAQAALDRQQQVWQQSDASLATLEKDADRRSQAVRAARKARTAAEQARANWREQLAQAERVHREAVEASRAAKAEVDRAAAVLEELRQGLAPACDGLPGGVQAVAALGSQRLDVLQAMHECDVARVAAVKVLAEAAELVAKMVQQEQAVRAEAAAAEKSLVVALSVNRVTEDDAAMAHRLGSDALLEEADALKALDEAVTRCRTELSLRASLRKEHEDHERPTLDAADALRALQDAQFEKARIEKLRMGTHAKVLFDDSMQNSRAQLQPQLQRADRELEIWGALADLIGSSAGDAFAVFAQGLTLDLLLLEANRRLEELARRYRLEKSTGGELDFVVVDLDMGGTRRSLHTLSGGETFLVSLALALALATLAAPRSRVETLFLDEGFGTLDAQNLEIALGALDSLQATGCQVGVISHVEGIAERIGAVVEVRPEGSGQSRVVARGC